jgi:ketosteroid isomerase-like protein
MRSHRTTLVLAAAALLAAACSRRIPGTDIKDTTDTRAVYALIGEYRAATERRDAPAVLALVSKKYFDDAGTSDPSDDVDYAQLKQRLGDDLAKVTALRLEIEVRQVEIENDRAAAYVRYDEHYRIATRAGEVAKNASDPHRMVFVREEGAWKIAGGL